MQVGLGPATVEKIVESVRLAGDARPFPVPPLQGEGTSFLSPRAQVGWNDFLSVYEKMQKTDGTPAELIKAVMDSKYAEYLEYEYPDYRERLQDIEGLGIFAEKQKDLNQFLAEASMQENYGREAVDSRHASNDEKLILSTVHQAKGLEWDAVFVINLASGQFPNDRALREEGGIEEERRLFYVAITRAKKYLYLTYPLSGGFDGSFAGPSMFLEEIDQDLVSGSGMTLGGGTVWENDDVVYEPMDEDKPLGGAQSKAKRGFLKDIDDL
jgi:DNA helicase-2/ATP-dependent DNA helicase PcrA